MKKYSLILFFGILCGAVVHIIAEGSFLIGIGCSSKEAANSVPYMSESADSFKRSEGSEKEPLEALEEKEPLEGFLPPEDSVKWLRDNHFQIAAPASVSTEFYIISCNYYDPKTKNRYNSRSVIERGSRVSISGPASAVVTIDTQGQLRVAPINTQE